MNWREAVYGLLLLYNHFILLYFLAINTQYLVLTLVGYWVTMRNRQEMQWRDLRRLMQSPLTPPISVLAPACNEEASIVANVRSLLRLHYPQFEVVVINDGSADGTLAVLIEAFALRPMPRPAGDALPCKPVRGVYESSSVPNLVVVDKDNGGKADALNAGLNVALHPLYCAVDADSILEEDALLRLVRPFLDHPGVTVAAGGHVRIANGCVVAAGRVVDVRLPRRALPLIQTVEYLRAFLFARTAWSAMNGLLIVSGAFGIFDRRAVVDAGGYASDTVGEDLELVLRLHHTLRDRGVPYRITFVADPVCWTEVPETLGTLRLQRNRWHRGLVDALWRHRAMVARPRFGVVGMLSMPCLVFFELLGPVVEVSGYLVVLLSSMLGWLDSGFALTFFAVAILYGVVLSVGAVLLEDAAFRRYPRLRHLLLLVLVGVIEHFGYRQLTAWWCVRAFRDFWHGDIRWGRMEHRGFGPSGVDQAPT